MRRGIGSAMLAAALLAAAAHPVFATDGHFLHGVGAINSAMGGAGVAMKGDIIGSFYLNPAGIAGMEHSRVTLGFEMFKPGRTVTGTYGTFSGSTDSKSEFVPVPSFGWAMPVTDKVAIGLGAIGVGGFGVDYPADTRNPVLAPRPNGFGQVYSNFGLLKIVPALGWQATDRLSIGVAVNVDYATLEVDPMPTASPAAGANGAFYSSATATDGAFGLGFQAGFIYDVTGTFSIGGSYASVQKFQDFEFNSAYANPALSNFGTPRTITFAMDVPQMITGGIAFRPTPAVSLAADVRYLTYSSTAGFDQQGFDNTGAVLGFGWDDIMVFAGGLELQPVDGLFLRGGYNYSQNPIPDALSFFNVPAPAVVQNHATLGLGFSPLEGFQLDLGYYHAFENSIDGPIWGPQGPASGSSVKSALREDSFLVQFSFTGR